MISKKKLIRDIINIIAIIFTFGLIFKILFVFIKNNDVIKEIIVGMGTLFAIGIFFYQREQSKSLGNIFADKIIKNDNKISIIKLILIITLIEIFLQLATIFFE